LANAITKKFTMKMEYKYSRESSLKTQSPNTPKSHYHIIEIIPQKRIQKIEIQTLLLLKTDGSWSLYLFFFSHYNTLLFLTLVLAPPKTRRKINTALCGAAPQNPKTKLAGKLTQAFSFFFLAWGCTLL